MKRGRPKQSPEVTAPDKAEFLKHFRACGVKYRAAEKAGVGNRTIWDWRKADPQFDADYHEVEEERVEEIDGRVQGIALGQVKATDTELRAAIFWLKSRNPRYCDKYQAEISGKGGGLIKLIVEYVSTKKPDSEDVEDADAN